MKVLIVDDDRDIRKLIKIHLEEAGFQTIEAGDGLQAIENASDSIDLIIMDLMMPHLDGLKACYTIREQYKMPILFLTAKGEDADKLTAFTFGGDDYLVKPFNPIDLVARVKAHIRRYRDYNLQPPNQDQIQVLDLLLDLTSHQLTKNNHAVKLTKKEFAILSLFFRNRGRVFSLEQIYEHVWNEDCILNSESTVSVHIRNLREKIEENIADPTYIKTIWGVGYRVD